MINLYLPEEEYRPAQTRGGIIARRLASRRLRAQLWCARSWAFDLMRRLENYPTRLIFIASQGSGCSVCSLDRRREATWLEWPMKNADDVVVATTREVEQSPHLRWTPFYKQRTTDAKEVTRKGQTYSKYERPVHMLHCIIRAQIKEQNKSTNFIVDIK